MFPRGVRDVLFLDDHCSQLRRTVLRLPILDRDARSALSTVLGANGVGECLCRSSHFDAEVGFCVTDALSGTACASAGSLERVVGR